MKHQKFDGRPPDEIAQDMLNWCVGRGCGNLGETNKEYRVTCPNINCPSRGKGESHRAFDINRDTAQYHCWHCGLKGIGLHGSKGLIATLESGDFSPSAFGGNQNASANLESFKPKKEAEPIMSKDELPPIAKALSKEAQKYFAKRGIPEYVYKDTDLRIFSLPVGGQLSFMQQPLNDTAIFFPVFNANRDVIHVHYKLIHDGYYMSPGPKPIYLTKATALSSTVICEGVFDALSAYTAGYRGAALLGHEITSNHDLSMFKSGKIVIMLDNDGAGKASINPVASTLASIASEVRIADIPPELGKDANDVLVNAGKEKLSELIQSAALYKPKEAASQAETKSTEPTTGTTQEATVSCDTTEPTTEQKPKGENEMANEKKEKSSELLDKEKLIELNNLHYTDVGNSQAFALFYGDCFRFDWKRKRWLVFNDGRWHLDDDGFATQQMKKVAKARLAAAALIEDDERRKKAVQWALTSEAKFRLSGALELAQSEPPFPASTAQFDTNPYLLGCANGVIDLKTGEQRQGKQEDYIMKTVAIAYNPLATCPRWMQFLDEIFLGNTELIDFIHRAIGYSLTGDTSEQCLFICYGTGWNGKSKFLALLRALLGDYARNTPFSTFTERYRDTTTNDVAALAGVRLVTSSEIAEGQRLNEARVKAMTGGDPITARFLYGEFFDYIPAYKVWLAVNHKPVIKGTDEGIWRRIRLIPFEASFKENPDPYIEEKLKVELEGILRWAVEGCLKWQQERLATAEKVKTATEEYKQESDVVAQFLAECTVEGKGVKVKSSDLYKAYRTWCEKNGEDPISGNAFGRRMTEKGYQKEKSGCVFYVGLGLLDENVVGS